MSFLPININKNNFKGVGSNIFNSRGNAAGGSTMITRFDRSGRNMGDAKSIFYDSYQDGYANFIRKRGLSDKNKRILASHPTVSSIISTRIRQVEDFLQPQTDALSKGMRLKKRNFNEKDVTAEEKKEINELYDYLLHCGCQNHPLHGHDFVTFVTKLLER